LASVFLFLAIYTDHGMKPLFVSSCVPDVCWRLKSTVLDFGFRCSPTAAFTAQHPSTCQVNFNVSLMFTHVSDFVLRLPLLLLSRGPVKLPLVVDVSLLLRPQSGTTCQKQSILQHLWRCSERHRRRNCLRDPTL